MNGVAHHAEDHGLDVVTEGDGRKGLIGRQQHRPQALAGQLAVDSGDDDVAVLRPVETFHDQQVAVEDTGVLHRQPLRAHQVGALRVTDADVVQRQALLEGVTDFQHLLAGVGLGDEEFTDIDAQLLRVTRIERVLFL